jgi:hypothetical protein
MITMTFVFSAASVEGAQQATDTRKQQKTTDCKNGDTITLEPVLFVFISDFLIELRAQFVLPDISHMDARDHHGHIIHNYRDTH